MTQPSTTSNEQMTRRPDSGPGQRFGSGLHRFTGIHSPKRPEAGCPGHERHRCQAPERKESFFSPWRILPGEPVRPEPAHRRAGWQSLPHWAAHSCPGSLGLRREAGRVASPSGGRTGGAKKAQRWAQPSSSTAGFKQPPWMDGAHMWHGVGAPPQAWTSTTGIGTGPHSSQ